MLSSQPHLDCHESIQALLHALKDHGAREIFGIPGDFALDFFAEVERAGVLPFTR